MKKLLGSILTEVEMVRNVVFLVIVIISVEAGGYAAPSFGGASLLIREFEDYKGSKYLRHNLELQEPHGVPETDVVYQEFEKSRKEFGAKKKEWGNLLVRAVYQNSYFPVTKGFYEKVDALKTDEEREQFLMDGYSLKKLYGVALTNNPEILGAYKKAEASLEKFDQVTGLDTILSQYDFFTRDLNIKVGKPWHRKPVNLNFPFPGILTLKGSIVDEEVKAARLAIEKTVQNVLSEINRVYFELSYIYEAIEITGETVQLLERLQSVIHTLYTTGKSTLNAALIIDMEIDKLTTSIEEKEDRAYAVQVRLNKLANISHFFSPEKGSRPEPVYLDYVTEKVISSALNQRIEIKLLKREIEKKKLVIELAEKRFYPEFTPGYSFFQNMPVSQTGSEAVMPAFSNRPMVRAANWFGNNDAFIREMRIDFQAMRDKLKSLENSSVDKLVQVDYKYQNTLRAYRLYRNKLVPKSGVSIGVTEALYSTGGVDFLELIDSQTRYLRYKLKLREAVRDSHIEAGRMDRISGSRVPRRDNNERDEK